MFRWHFYFLEGYIFNTKCQSTNSSLQPKWVLVLTGFSTKGRAAFTSAPGSPTGPLAPGRPIGPDGPFSPVEPVAPILPGDPYKGEHI